MNSTFRVYKFGGASVKDVSSIHNVAHIIAHHAEEPLAVVVSAMGKTTNALEVVIAAVMNADESGIHHSIQTVVDFHRTLTDELFAEGHPVLVKCEDLYVQLRQDAVRKEGESYGELYDRLVCFGEMLSTTIVAAVLQDSGIQTTWHNAHDLIRTNADHRRATVDFVATEESVRSALSPEGVHIVQGFLGATSTGIPTTLGREGSDYTAAVLAYVLDAAEVAIWKDVPGVLTGDPKVFDDVVRLETISFREAIELAYYGASVIHPKTIQPLQRKGIPLRVRSFVDPTAPGTTIQTGEALVPMSPCFIRKDRQVLITLGTRDLAFIVENHLSVIYQIFHEFGVAVNMMQNSAVSSSFAITHDPVVLPSLLDRLKSEFSLKHNEGLTLYTIRHYNAEAVNKMRQKGEVFLEQVTRHTHQMVLKENV